jgi:hypothetical protein
MPPGRRTITPPALAALLLTAPVVAGCGDTNDRGAATPSEVSPDRPIASTTTTSHPVSDESPTAPSVSATSTTTFTTVEPTAATEPDRAPPPETETPTTTEEPPMATPSLPASGPVAVAIADLADRLGVDADAIEVTAAEEVTWSDGSLGCPMPGRIYTQALVNGTRIVLRTGGSVYEYHAGRSGEPFYCPPERIIPPVIDPGV